MNLELSDKMNQFNNSKTVNMTQEPKIIKQNSRLNKFKEIREFNGPIQISKMKKPKQKMRDPRKEENQYFRND